MKHIALLIVFFLNTINLIRITSHTEVCDQIKNAKDSTVKFYGETQEYNFDLVHQFARAKKLGEGASGLVKLINFGINNIPTMAVKRIKQTDGSLIDELETLINMNEISIGPKFYFCQYDSVYVYVAQEHLFENLYSTYMRLSMLKFSHSHFLRLMRTVFSDVVKMSTTAFLTHGDLKEENIMFDPTFSKLVLIDFGLVQNTFSPLQAYGTPFYLSPPKLNPKATDLPTFKDDFYALAIMIGDLNTVFADQTILIDWETKLPIEKACGKNVYKESCQNTIRKNIRSVLEKANFGAYTDEPDQRTRDKVNFTTLVDMMIEFYNYPFSEIETLHIFDRIILDFLKIETNDAVFKRKGENAIYPYPMDPLVKFSYGRQYPRVSSTDLANLEYELKRDLKKVLPNVKEAEAFTTTIINVMSSQIVWRAANIKKYEEIVAANAEKDNNVGLNLVGKVVMNQIREEAKKENKRDNVIIQEEGDKLVNNGVVDLKKIHQKNYRIDDIEDKVEVLEAEIRDLQQRVNSLELEHANQQTAVADVTTQTNRNILTPGIVNPGKHFKRHLMQGEDQKNIKDKQKVI